MEIRVKESSGLVRVIFLDNVDNECIIQAYTSTYGEDKLRIGVRVSNDGTDSTPMCLSKEDVLLLLPLLQHFAKHGKLPFEFIEANNES